MNEKLKMISMASNQIMKYNINKLNETIIDSLNSLGYNYENLNCLYVEIVLFILAHIDHKLLSMKDVINEDERIEIIISTINEVSKEYNLDIDANLLENRLFVYARYFVPIDTKNIIYKIAYLALMAIKENSNMKYEFEVEEYNFSEINKKAIIKGVIEAYDYLIESLKLLNEAVVVSESRITANFCFISTALPQIIKWNKSELYIEIIDNPSKVLEKAWKICQQQTNDMSSIFNACSYEIDNYTIVLLEFNKPLFQNDAMYCAIAFSVIKNLFKKNVIVKKAFSLELTDNGQKKMFYEINIDGSRSWIEIFKNHNLLEFKKAVSEYLDMSE